MGWEIRFFNIIIFGNTKELHAFLDVSIIDDGSRRRERYISCIQRKKTYYYNLLFIILYTHTRSRTNVHKRNTTHTHTQTHTRAHWRLPTREKPS